MTKKLIDNPSSKDVADIIAGIWWRLLEHVGGNRKLLPALAQSREDIANTGRYAVYGCGVYGCVFKTETRGLVLKVTKIPHEVGFAKFVRNHPHLGMIQVFDYLNLTDLYPSGLHAIWRSEVYGPGQRFPDWLIDGLHDVSWVTQGINGWLERKGYRTHEVVRLNRNDLHNQQLLDAMQDYVENVTTLRRIPLGNALEYYVRHGFLLGDMHPMNVGHDEAGNHTIFDYFALQIEQTHMDKLLKEIGY